MANIGPSQVDSPWSFLARYLGKTLRITAIDRRVFVGQMKCTDRECNIILALTQEYRPPSDEDVEAAAQAQAFVKTGAKALHVSPVTSSAVTGKVNVSFTNRFVGLVVVPGKHIAKIELEEWAGLDAR